MSFVRSKMVNGHEYLYLVENQREGQRVRQTVLRYLGRAGRAASERETDAQAEVDDRTPDRTVVVPKPAPVIGSL
jgi:hypothetical protein